VNPAVVNIHDINIPVTILSPGKSQLLRVWLPGCLPIIIFRMGQRMKQTEFALIVVMALKAAGLYDGGWESWRDGWANIPG
jgi:hypothetical protein